MQRTLNKFVNLIFVLFLAIPLPVFAYHTETQAPYQISISYDNTNGEVTLTWQESDGLEDNPPEYYRLFYGDTDTADDYSVDTTFGFTEALSNQTYTFSAEQIYNAFETTDFVFYAKIQARDDSGMTYSDMTSVVNVSYYYVYVPPSTTTSTTSSTTTSSTSTTTTTTTSTTTTTLPPETTTTTTTTTSTTTTTTLPPKPPPPPPPPTTTTTTLYVVVNEDGSESEYTKTEVEDGTVKRDEERKKNEKEYGCYMTNAQIDRGDCEMPEKEDMILEEEVIIEVDEKEVDTKGKFSDDDVVVPELELEDEVEVDIPFEKNDADKEDDLEIEVVELPEETQLDDDFIVVEDEVDELPESEDIKDEPIVVVEVEEDVEEVLVKPIQKDVEERPFDELTGAEVVIEVAEVVEVIELEIEEDLTDEQVAEKIEEYVDELETEEVIEVLEEVNDVGVQNLEQVSEEVQEVVQAVVEEAIENVEELTEEQVKVVADVLQVETEDVAIVAEQVKSNVAVAQAVEEYVERAVENADVEDYTLADVTTEIQFESFVADPISVIVDIDFDNISLNNIADDMTQDQRDKAQEVIVPTVLVRIVSMFRRLSW